MPDCPRGARFEHKAVLCAFNAHVRSVLQYGSVVWSGAAVTHLARLERLQHRFLMWLGAKTQQTPPRMDYHSLLQYFKTDSIKARLIHADIMFLHNVFHHRIDSDHLLSMFGLNVPGRRNRRTGLFHIPYGRVNTVKNSLGVRIPSLCNQLLAHNPSADFYYSSASFRREALEFARTLGSYAD